MCNFNVVILVVAQDGDVHSFLNHFWRSSVLVVPDM